MREFRLSHLSLVVALCFWPLLQSHAIEPVSKLDIQQLIISEAQRLDFPASLALAVAEVESGFQPYAVSEQGALGVMQIMPATGWGEFGVPEMRLLEPRLNVVTGIRFLKQLLAQYSRVDIALSHYNGGSAVRTARGNLRVIPATRSYVQQVLRASQRYEASPLVVNIRKGALRSRHQRVRELDDFGGIGLNRDKRPVTVAENTDKNIRGTGWQPIADRGNANAQRRAQVRRWESVYDR